MYHLFGVTEAESLSHVEEMENKINSGCKLYKQCNALTANSSDL